MRRWAVEETGRVSVRPWTRPRTTDWKGVMSSASASWRGQSIARGRRRPRSPGPSGRRRGALRVEALAGPSGAGLAAEGGPAASGARRELRGRRLPRRDGSGPRAAAGPGAWVHEGGTRSLAVPGLPGRLQALPAEPAAEAVYSAVLDVVREDVRAAPARAHGARVDFTPPQVAGATALATSTRRYASGLACGLARGSALLEQQSVHRDLWVMKRPEPRRHREARRLLSGIRSGRRGSPPRSGCPGRGPSVPPRGPDGPLRGSRVPRRPGSPPPR